MTQQETDALIDDLLAGKRLDIFVELDLELEELSADWLFGENPNSLPTLSWL